MLMNKIKKAFSFSGRAKRSRLLQFIPVVILFWFGAAYLDEMWIAPNLCEINDNWECLIPGQESDRFALDFYVFILLLIPLFAVMVRRLHDHDRSGWFSMLAVPGIVWLGSFLYRPEFSTPTWYLVLATVAFAPLAFWFVTKGNKDENRFGK